MARNTKIRKKLQKFQLNVYVHVSAQQTIIAIDLIIFTSKFMIITECSFDEIENTRLKAARMHTKSIAE